VIGLGIELGEVDARRYIAYVNLQAVRPALVRSPAKNHRTVYNGPGFSPRGRFHLWTESRPLSNPLSLVPAINITAWIPVSLALVVR